MAEASIEEDGCLAYSHFVPRAAALILKLQDLPTQAARRAQAAEADQGALSGVSDDEISSSLAEACAVKDTNGTGRLTRVALAETINASLVRALIAARDGK
jgi:hypothetical protein